MVILPDLASVLLARNALMPVFEARMASAEPPDLLRALVAMDALVEEARALGAWPPGNPLEGIEVDVRVARALAGVR
jgi:hypothetical protein